ncbi:KdsC family phosphatase [Gynurincola endophyticus]|uniref:KdsC family phosphatase n=1 Tax=Gynurincola endophyticus TaxID=2479004 RepID=UPI000F8C9884|nr:HAD-IIIA family hydrolase [Gynurincola endophyticus]
MLDQLKNIKAFVFDMDGVLTDGSLTVHPEGELIRTMNVKDGYAMQFAIKRGYKMAVISGGVSQPAEIRFQKLGLTAIHMGVRDKVEVLKRFMSEEGINAGEVLYVGDDIPDLEVMQMVGVSACPHDAVPEIQAIAHYISPVAGGKGCVREIIEKVLKLQKKWVADTHIPST